MSINIYVYNLYNVHDKKYKKYTYMYLHIYNQIKRVDM